MQFMKKCVLNTYIMEKEEETHIKQELWVCSTYTFNIRWTPPKSRCPVSLKSDFD